MQKRGLLLLGFIAIVMLGAATPAAAHNTVSTADGKYFLTVGHLNEPITTYVKTGLDMTIRANVSGQRGGEIDGAHQTLTAVYKSPSGKEMAEPLAKQFGTTGRYSFEEPFILTEAGQYVLHLSGTINGTAVDMDINVAGPVPDFRDHTFPDELQTQKQLQNRITALEAQVQELEAHAGEDHEETSEARGFSPGIDAVLFVVVLGVAGLMMRRRA